MVEKVTLYTSPMGEWEVAKCGEFKVEGHRLEEYDIRDLLEHLGHECEIIEVSDEEIMVM